MKNKNNNILNKKLKKKEFEKAKNYTNKKSPKKIITQNKDKKIKKIQESSNKIIMKKEIQSSPLNKENPENLQFTSNPKDLVFLRHITVDDSYNTYSNIFQSIDNIFYLIYANKNNNQYSIVLYKLIEDIKITEIKNAHKERITNIKYHLDKVNRRDLIISSSYDNNIKLWDINRIECLFNYEKIYDNGYIKSICFLNDNNQIYIASSNTSKNNLNPIKIFDLNGNLMKELNNSKNNVLFIEYYNDNNNNKIYIITCNEGSVISYDYQENKLYQNYCDETQSSSIEHTCVVIHFSENILKLIESDEKGYIRIWNFHSAELINKIKICDEEEIRCLSLWNNEYILVGCYSNIKLRDLNNGKKSKNLELYCELLYNLKKIIHPQYGECLVSLSDNSIKLWGNKIYKK